MVTSPLMPTKGTSYDALSQSYFLLLGCSISKKVIFL